MCLSTDDDLVLVCWGPAVVSVRVMDAWHDSC